MKLFLLALGITLARIALAVPLVRLPSIQIKVPNSQTSARQILPPEGLGSWRRLHAAGTRLAQQKTTNPSAAQHQPANDLIATRAMASYAPTPPNKKQLVAAHKTNL